MSGLSSKARAFVDATRLADEPSAEDFERIHAAIASRVAVGAAGAVVFLSANAAASTAATVPAANGVANAVASVAATGVAGGGAVALGIPSTLAVTAKVATWVVAIGLAGGAVAVTSAHGVGSRSTSPPAITESAPPKAVPSARTRVRATTPTAREGASSVSEGLLPSGDVRPASSAQAAHGARDPAGRAEAPLPASTSTTHDGTLDDELALMRRAHAALNDGRAADALALLDEHARRFPSGVLAEDRSAQRALALCALDRFETAEAEGQRFVSNYPRSPYVAAIRSSCAFVSDPKK